MRKILATAAIAALAFSTVAADDEIPVEHTFHLHGTYHADEAYWADGLDGVSTMDSTAPTAAEPKSRFATNYSAGPNPNCSGNGLLATWAGNVEGRVVGEVSVAIPMVSTGATVVAELFPDGGGGCNEAYIEPLAREIVEVAPGQGTFEATFTGLDIEVADNLTVQFRILGEVTVSVSDDELGVAASRTIAKPNEQIRFLFDSTDFDGTVTFDCVPLEGSDTCEW